MSDSDEYYDSGEETEVKKEDPPPGTKGLALAQHYFGPLLSPVAATATQWTAYSRHRLAVNAQYKNVFDRRKGSVNDAVATIEKELGLNEGALRKCVSVLSRFVVMDDVKPRTAERLVRIYSLAAPKCVDVHIKYHSRSRMHWVEWFYSIGYKIYNRISGEPTAFHEPSMKGDASMWHCRGGWQSICWGYYDDEDNPLGPKWRPIEVGEVELHEEGVLDVHEALFGPIEAPTGNDADAVLEYRRKLVATVRFLLAAVGIGYEVACTDDERDEEPYEYVLEGLSNRWVARGIRAACGFQLSGDEEAEKLREAERQDMAGEDDDDDEDEEDEDAGDYFLRTARSNTATRPFI